MLLLDQQHQHQHLKLVKKFDDPLTMYANDILTIPVNLAGVPGISVPCGFAEWSSTRLTNYRKAF